MKQNIKAETKSYFSFEKETDEFNECLSNFINTLIKNEHSKVIPAKNIHTYTHGQKWVSTDSYDQQESTLKVHSSETLIKFDDVIGHKIEILPNLISENVRLMVESAKRVMYQTISSSCEEVGNTVHRKDYSDLADLYLAIIEKLEFGVDEEGRVTLPEMHVGSIEYVDKLESDLMSKDASFHHRLQNIFREKVEAALKNEQIRLGKFVRQ